MKLQRRGLWLLTLLLVPVLLFAAACGDDDDSNGSTGTPTGTAAPTETAPAGTPTATEEPGNGGEPELSGQLIVYSGRSEALIGPIIDQFAEETGLDVRVRYGGTPVIAAAILEEGARTPADVYIGQDAGSVGRLALDGFFAPLPEHILERVPAQYRSPDGVWVGLSGRARVVTYNTDMHTAESLPDSILDYANPEWAGKVGWSPSNASFQSFVTAFRKVHGDDAVREWLEAMVANGAVSYPGNGPIVQAVADGEIEVGFPNHYYLNSFIAEQGEGFKARNYYFTNGDIGGLVNVAGAGMLVTAANRDAALAFIEFMLRDESQAWFAQETTEFPLVPGVSMPVAGVPAIETLNPVDVDLTDLGDLDATITMLQETGALP